MKKILLKWAKSFFRVLLYRTKLIRIRKIKRLIGLIDQRNPTILQILIGINPAFRQE
jgi:hypothetical protein